ncbi:CPBP family glutamic-type intramembrane protease [Nonomuraea fuscirosea]|uniref:CPBP family glutamic-type intramembrane protease n=1 Tax=Nonomuraea fuscirosea TaxID=1291556 RepID=UPI0034008528
MRSVAFFALVFLLTVPFLVLGTVAGTQILPGLPLTALAAVCPVAAAVILEYRRGGGAGVGALLRRSFDFHRIEHRGWYVPILLLYPAVLVASFIRLRLIGIEVPVLRIALVPVPAMAAAFFMGALCEELGWSAYAVDALRERCGALRTALIVGVVWAVWYWPALLQAHRALSWIAWWSLATVAARVIMVWLYDNTGRSVFAVTLFHAISNLGWQLFPVHGSYFDQPSVAVIMAAVAVVIAVILGFGVRIEPAMIAGMLGAIVAGVACFTVLGALVVAFVRKQQTVGALTLGTFLPLAFVSDVFVMGGELPGVLSTIGDLFPLKHLSHTLLAVLDPAGRPWPWADLAVIAAWTLAAAAVLVLKGGRWTAVR